MNINVCYLARWKDGADKINRFLASYNEHPAGLPHLLNIIHKGQHEWPHSPFFRHLTICDFGYDVRAWRIAAEQLDDAEIMLFITTASEIACDNWLEPAKHFNHPNVGIVATFKNDVSFYTCAKERGDRIATCVNRFLFDPYPNPHMRTNFFFARRDIMLRFWPRFALSKWHSCVNESGKRGFYRRVLKAGYKVVFTDKWFVHDKHTVHFTTTP